MKQSEETCKSLIMHYQNYPLLQIEDILKYIYQSTFGCEHMVFSLEASTAFIEAEASAMPACDGPLYEPLDGGFCRVHLSYIRHGLSAETLGRLFFESAKEKQGNKQTLSDKLREAKKLVREKALPFSETEFLKACRKWEEDGFPALHHSDVFKKEYAPSYRVIANRYVPFLPFLAELDKMGKDASAVIAIEGGSASGKSTLGELLKSLYDCTVFHMDDFFLRPEQRTRERYAEIGGNIDHERFIEEVLTPLEKGTPIHHRKLDCATMTLSSPTTIAPKKLVIIEGVYSMHPKFKKYYDFSLFLDISDALQRQRILKRNSPEIARNFFDKWIPLEQMYFGECDIKNRCDLSIPIL